MKQAGIGYCSDIIHLRAAYGGVTNREWVQVRPLSRQSLVTPLRLARPALLVLVMLLASLSPILMLPEQKEQTIDGQSNESEFEKYRFSIDENRIFDRFFQFRRRAFI